MINKKGHHQKRNERQVGRGKIERGGELTGLADGVGDAFRCVTNGVGHAAESIWGKGRS